MTTDERKDRLFRGKVIRRYAKEIQKGEWIIGGYVGDYNMGGVGATPCIYYNNGAMYMVEVDPGTIGKCTGLRDKNGALVFEGDLLTWLPLGQGDIPCIVQWLNGSFVVDGGNTWDYIDTEIGGAVVVGNIHDNPELLEGDIV